MAVALKLSNKVRKIAHRYFCSRAEIERLHQFDHPIAPKVARAFGSALDGSFSIEERVSLDAIEALRRRLNRSDEPLETVDYGAGSGSENRSEDAMRSGRPHRTTVGRLAGERSKSAKWCRMLFQLVRECRPTSCLELGTCLGVSAAYQAAALSLNGAGRLTTIEGAPALASLARKNLDNLGLDRVDIRAGRFQDTLDGVLAEIAPVDYVFIDGHHDGAATLRYFERVASCLGAPAIVVFDDIRWSRGMLAAWRQVTADARVAIGVDLFNLGVTVVDPGRSERALFKISFG
ncbi:MAG: O-methyltransferase [Planctomycetota bacterium]|jgi:predicted O-methyltransferase YrrM